MDDKKKPTDYLVQLINDGFYYFKVYFVKLRLLIACGSVIALIVCGISSFEKEKKVREAEYERVKPLVSQFIVANCQKTRVGGYSNTTIYICNNGDNEYTWNQIFDKVK